MIGSSCTNHMRLLTSRLFQGVGLWTRSMTRNSPLDSFFPGPHNSAARLRSALFTPSVCLAFLCTERLELIARADHQPLQELRYEALRTRREWRTNYAIDKLSRWDPPISSAQFTEIYARISFRVIYPKGGTVGAGRHT
jgi:hypothetical protein